MHTLKKHVQISILIMFMTAGFLQAAPLMSLAQPAIEPSPLDVLENNGEGNVTFLMSERNDEVVAGSNRFKVTVTLGKISLKNDDISGVKILDARNANADVTSKFDVNYLSAPDYIVRIQQKASEDLPGDMRYLVVIPITVRVNTPVTNPGNGFLVNMSSEGDALADGDSSDYTFTRAAAAAVDDNVTTSEDTAVDINVTANDTNTTASVDSVTQPANGAAIVNPDGTVKYTPDLDFVGVDTFTYTADGLTATVTVTVGAINDAPVAVDDNETTPEDIAVDINVTMNDTDPDGDTLTVTTVTQPSNGTAVKNANGTITYTPDANFNGTDTFEYTVTDALLADTATVTVTITPVNDAPVAEDDTSTTPEDTAVDINVTLNDTDVDGDALSVDSFVQPTNGTVIQNADGTLKYTPDANFNGTDTFEYTVTDGNLTDTATVTVTITPVNDAPVAEDDNDTTLEDVAVDINVTLNDTDVDGDALSVDSFVQPSNGTVTENVDGTLKYTPDENFNGTDTFEYTVTDGILTDTATVTVTITPVNDAPVAVDDVSTTPENTAVDINASDLLSNDSDVDGDTLTITSVDNPTNGTVVLVGTTVTFTPDANTTGPATFEYTISDGNGETDTATVTIDVGAVNDAPVANDDTTTATEDTPKIIDVLDNDTDENNDSLTVTSVTSPTNGTTRANVDGTVTYTPNAGFNGTDTFEYTIQDGNGGEDTATVTVTVNEVNDSPQAINDTASTPEDAAVTISVLDNDSDTDGDTLTIDSVTNPTNGRVTTNGSTVTYTPDANFNGTDTFTYTISDGKGGTDTATVLVTISPVNDAPVAVNDTNTTESGTPLVIPASELLKNDTDPEGDTLTIISVGSPTNGTVTLVGTTVTFTPDENASGLTGTFTYTIEDEEGATSTATVTVGIDTASAPDITSMDDNTSTTVKTDDSTPEINGTCEAGLEVIVQINGEDIEPTTTCKSDGTFSMIPDDALRDGEYNVTVEQIEDGERSPTSPVRVLIIELAATATPTPSPTSSPTATTSPSPTASPTATTSPTATATTRPTATATASPTATATPEAVQTCSDTDAPVAANDSADITKGEVSTINVQSNDTGTDLIANSTRLLDDEGKAATTLYVEGKGTWLVDTTTGAILFDPDDVCEGTVSVKYVIADKCGNQSNPATVTVSFDGTCESTQSSDSGDALGNISMLLLALLTGTLGLFFVRREELNALVK
ncbi:MAG: internalin, putative [uncultured Sulfurovum sp.]|uniref:Internalin, putative n=1 Tax=uncultured Sulfurovum sp. TaxID=269237 RepID=A0A6S6TX52_9BACT|nr:MAG: internalin, putative [uncultured Sulfurovum sp.]